MSETIKVSFDENTAADHELVAAEAGKKIVLVSMLLVASDAVSVQFKSAANNISGVMPLAANAGFVLDQNYTGHTETNTGEALNLNLSAAIQVGGMLSYRLEDG